MKKVFFGLFVFTSLFLYSQEEVSIQVPKRTSYIQAEYFYGNILRHQASVAPLVIGHPEGLILSWNQRYYGREQWEERFGYPDYGVSFSYQNYKNKVLGDLYAIYGHYNFYLFKTRQAKNKVILRMGIGLAYNTNPYDKETNSKNISFGTHLNSSTYFKLYYQRERIIDKFGLEAGLTFIHASNSSIKAPNTGINTWGITVGVNYDFEKEAQEFVHFSEEKKHREPIHFNAVLLGGANESDHIDTGVFPFAEISVYADKRLSWKSGVLLGAELHLYYYIKELIKYEQAFHLQNIPEKKIDWKRIGITGGYELFLNKVSIMAQLGYYVYAPYKGNSNFYERLAIKRTFGKNWYAIVGLKAHFANAESVEFGLGYRFNR